MNVISYLTVRTDQDILTIKSYLAAGYLVSVSIDANQYKNLTEKDVWSGTHQLTFIPILITQTQ